MQGPTQPREQAHDQRESTVVMPRIDPHPAADPGSSTTAGARADQVAVAEPPEFGDPYALPSSRSEQTLTAGPAADRAEASGPAPASEPAPREEPPGQGGLGAEYPAPQHADLVPSRNFDETQAAEPTSDRAPDRPARAVPGAARPAGTGQPAELTAPAPPAGQAVVARPALGSIADLQARLTRLPDGHPSALHDEAGRARPAPTRLRQLELGLPAPEWSAPSGLVSNPRPPDPVLAEAQPDEAASSLAADNSAPAPNDSPAGVDHAPAAAGGPAPALDDHHAGSAAAEDGETPAGRPGRAVAEQHSEPDPGGNGHRGARTDWQDPYAFSAEGGTAGNGNPPAAPWPATDAPDSANGSGNANGHRPRARELDPAAAARMPSLPPLATDRPDPARHDTVQLDTRRRRAPQRPADASDGAQPVPAEGAVRDSVQAPQHRDLVGRILAASRVAEGRNVFGGYGSSGITPALQRIAAQLPAGGLAPGSEDDTLKPADRLAAKLGRLIARQPGRPPAELAASISDVIRFAFTFTAADYSEGTWLVHRKLKTQGFELEARRNRWDSPEYKGVFTSWRDPAHGVAFEVQFHTVDSWAVVKQTHAAYVRITDSATLPAERARLRAGQAAATATVESPPGWMDIADFRSATA
jgi:hypothetical protein